jgi:hypothetical protein
VPIKRKKLLNLPQTKVDRTPKQVVRTPDLLDDVSRCS